MKFPCNFVTHETLPTVLTCPLSPSPIAIKLGSISNLVNHKAHLDAVIAPL